MGLAIDAARGWTRTLRDAAGGGRAFVRLVPLRGEQPAGGVREEVPGRGLLDEDKAAGPDDAPGLAEGVVDRVRDVMQDRARGCRVEGAVPDREACERARRRADRRAAR